MTSHLYGCLGQGFDTYESAFPFAFFSMRFFVLRAYPDSVKQCKMHCGKHMWKQDLAIELN